MVKHIKTIIVILLAIQIRTLVNTSIHKNMIFSTSTETQVEKVIVGFPLHQYISLPVCSSSTAKSYMDWTKTSATSRQGKFMREHMTVKDGLLYDNEGFIGVALGSYFGEVGDRFIFTLSTGIILYLIKVEEKSDWHTVDGCKHTQDGSVIEFVIDIPTNKFPYFSNQYIANGNYNNLEQFKGSIVSVKKEVKNN